MTYKKNKKRLVSHLKAVKILMWDNEISHLHGEKNDTTYYSYSYPSTT